MGLLENQFHEGIDMKAGSELALNAIKAAVARDTISGDGVDMLLIGVGGIEERSYPLKS
jgi:proteasome beta subunit